MRGAVEGAGTARMAARVTTPVLGPRLAPGLAAAPAAVLGVCLTALAAGPTGCRAGASDAVPSGASSSDARDLGPDITGRMVPVTDTLQRPSALPAGRYRVVSRGGPLAGAVLLVSAEYDRANREHQTLALLPRALAGPGVAMPPGRDTAVFQGHAHYVRPDSLTLTATCGGCVTTVGHGIRAVDQYSSYLHTFRARALGGGRVELREALPGVPAYADTLERLAAVDAGQ